MSIDNQVDRQLCTGCGACAYCCPLKAITMKRTGEGFLYPTVEQNKCIQCDKCVSVCHVNIAFPKRKRISVQYGWHNDPIIQKTSSSGGAFTALAQAIFDKNGAVYGHVLNKESLYVQCDRALCENEIGEMRQSKYVESDISRCFDKIVDDLASRPVLFSGTPCQCAAIYQTMGDNKNLYLVSILCHGVGAPDFFREHFHSISNGKLIKNFLMRDKRLGWHDYTIRVSYHDNSKDYIRHYSLDSYYYCDLALDLFERDSCYTCKYRNGHCSDVTIGDYWNINDTVPSNNNKGISLVIANTLKGKQLIDSLRNMHLAPLELSDCEYAFYKCKNKDDEYVNDKMERKRVFIQNVEQNGFDAAANEYMNNMTLRRLKVIIKEFMKFTNTHR